ncbi:MAG TPA: hypothetical protein VMT60_03420 [Candidatus Bathyarchaeia archaeon]|nr:hypothetical protein [Candidatus Bathyarchaeia archaeon]
MGTAVFILEAIVIALSLVAGLGRIGGPDVVRVALAFFALFVIPGASLERMVFRSRASSLETSCRVFILGLIFVSTVVCAGFVPGVSYGPISVLASGLALVLAAAVYRMPRRIRWAGEEAGEGGAPPARQSAARSRVVVAGLFALCFFAFSGSGDLAWNTDSLDHVSFVRRSVDSGVLFPHDSFYREGDGVSLDPRKGLWHPVLSLWTYQSHASADRVWRALPGFVAFFALASFTLVALELGGSALSAAVSLLFFLLFYGGEGFGWLTKLGLSRNIAQIALWIDLAFLITYCRTRKREYLIVTFLIACMGVAVHVGFALFVATVVLGLLVYVTFLPGGERWRGGFLRSAAAQLCGAMIPLAVRFRAASSPVNVIHTHMQGMLVFARGLAIVDPAEIATRYGLVFFYALVMTPFFFIVAPRTERRSLLFTLFVVPVILVLNPLSAAVMERRIGYLHYRILDAAPLLVVAAVIVTGLCEILMFGGTAKMSGGRGARRGGVFGGVAKRFFAAAGLAVLVLYPLRSSVSHIGASARAVGVREAEPPAAYAALFKALAEGVPAHSVIVSDPVTSYVLSAYTDHFVAVTLDQHGSPTDTRAMERLLETRNLLNPAVALTEGEPWLERTGADYVLLNMDASGAPDFFCSVPPGGARGAYEKFFACPSVLTEVLESGQFRLFSVHRDALGGPQAGGCASPRASAIPCGDKETALAGSGDDWQRLVVGTGLDAGCGVVLENLTIDNATLFSGDTLRGHFCWRTTAEVPFGLPLEAAIRIDTAFPRGRLYHAWYGKQYRRIIERRTGRFWRLTWQSRLLSGCTYPDMWEPGRVVRQDFSFPLSRALAPGAYELRVKVRRVPYLANRSPADYLLNDDSLEGVLAGMVYVQGHFGESVSVDGSRYAAGGE